MVRALGRVQMYQTRVTHLNPLGDLLFLTVRKGAIHSFPSRKHLQEGLAGRKPRQTMYQTDLAHLVLDALV
jgi:hypothetical protein